MYTLPSYAPYHMGYEMVKFESFRESVLSFQKSYHSTVEIVPFFLTILLHMYIQSYIHLLLNIVMYLYILLTACMCPNLILNCNFYNSYF